MDKKRLMAAGGCVVLMAVAFVGLNKVNQPAPVVQAPAPEPKVIRETVDYVDVLGVVEPISKGQRVQADDLTWIKWPEAAASDALIQDDPEADIAVIDQIAGSIARDPLLPGEPLTYSRFIRAGEAGIMAALLRPGMRATTIRISVDTASGGFIQPGDKVDVVLKKRMAAVPTSRGGTGQRELVANTIFENVSVLAIDQNFTNAPENGAALPGSTATLELSPEDSRALLVAQDEGDLVLLLRGFSGANARAASRATQAPAQTPVQKEPLAVFRAGNIETVQLQQR